MTTLRKAVWAFIVTFAVLTGWFAYEIYNSDIGLTEKPYGKAFELVDMNGKPITEQAFRGQPTALFFGFTHCPEVCPTTLYELDGWMRKVDPEGSRIKAYFVTVDPERDSPELMKEYVEAVSDRITGISGDPKKVADAIKGFHVYAKKVAIKGSQIEDDYTMDHTASVFLLDSNGRFKSTIAWGENPETAIKKLENLIKG